VVPFLIFPSTEERLAGFRQLDVRRAGGQDALVPILDHVARCPVLQLPIADHDDGLHDAAGDDVLHEVGLGLHGVARVEPRIGGLGGDVEQLGLKRPDASPGDGAVL